MFRKVRIRVGFLLIMFSIAVGAQKKPGILDFTEVCSKFADFHQSGSDYCSHFNNTCSKIFRSKEICATMELDCGSIDQKCVLHHCREYTGQVRQLEAPKNKDLSDWEYMDHTMLVAMIAKTKINGTNYCGRYEFSCLRSFEQLQREVGNVCRTEGPMCVQDKEDEQKGKGTCDFVRCSEEQQTAENHPVIPFDSLTVRTTPVSETDIDETKYAVESALHFGYGMNYCDAFYKGCQRCAQYDSADSGQQYRIKEMFCVPQRTGGPAQGACILTEELTLMTSLFSRRGIF